MLVMHPGGELAVAVPQKKPPKAPAAPAASKAPEAPEAPAAHERRRLAVCCRGTGWCGPCNHMRRCMDLARRGGWTEELRRAVASHPARNTANGCNHNGLAHWLAHLVDDPAWLTKLFDFMGREGYDLGAANCHGNTPAHIVARRFPPRDAGKLWNVLLRHGASLQALDNWGNTPQAVNSSRHM